MSSRLYVATYTPKGDAAWGEWTLSGDAEVLAIDAIEVPGRGPVLGILVKRPSGIYLETVALSEGDGI